MAVVAVTKMNLIQIGTPECHPDLDYYSIHSMVVYLSRVGAPGMTRSPLDRLQCPSITMEKYFFKAKL